jgi:hypothetical protein
MRGLRARKRGLTSLPAEAETPPTVPAEAPGPVVAAVQADIAGLGELRGYQSLAAAVAMGRPRRPSFGDHGAERGEAVGVAAGHAA